MNRVKSGIEAALEHAKEAAAAKALEAELRKEPVDVTLPGLPRFRGHRHPVSRAMDDIIEIFARLGFSVADGPELECDLYNFEMLAIPPDHPARDRLPRVILLTFFDKLPCKELKLTRNNVFERDKNTCQYCARVLPREQLNLDHVIPRNYGGKTTWENILCSCVKCNTRKANRLPHEAAMRLIRKPSRPKWRPVISLVLGTQNREIWKDFLDLAYWNVELEE